MNLSIILSIYAIIILLIYAIIFFGYIYFLWNDYVKNILRKFFFIKFRALAVYNKLEERYNAKYPTIMNEIYSPFEELSVFDNCKAFFFVSDNCFRIISPKRPELNTIIPFSDVICHHSVIQGEKRNTHYKTLFQLCILINGAPKWLGFENLPYNHKIDKKYGNRLNGKDLYNFICENFMNEDEYKAKNPHVEL